MIPQGYDRNIIGSEARLDFVVGFVGPERAPFFIIFLIWNGLVDRKICDTCSTTDFGREKKLSDSVRTRNIIIRN